MAGLRLSIDPTGMVSGGKQAESALDRVKRHASDAEAALDRTGTNGGKSMAALGTSMRALARIAGVTLGSLAAGFSLGKFISATSKADAGQAQLAAAIRSTGGAAGQTITSLNATAAALQRTTKFGDETTNAMQGVLLTFTNIKGDAFTRATVVVQDLATAMGMDLKSAALQVGKALNDPVLGVTALARAGIQFSAAQKTAIKSMVEANNVAGAQKIVFAELERQFGGSAEAARNTLGGALAALGNAWGDLFEIGNKSSDGLRKAVESLISAISAPQFVAAIQSIGTGMFAASEVAVKALGILGNNIGEIASIAGAFAAFFAGRFVFAMGAAALGIGGVTTGLVALKGALLRTGVGALIVGVGELAYRLNLFDGAADKAASAQTRMNEALGLYARTASPDAKAAAIEATKAYIDEAKAKLANASATLTQMRAEILARENIATGGENRPDIPGVGSLEMLKLQTVRDQVDEIAAGIRLAVVEMDRLASADPAAPLREAVTEGQALAQLNMAAGIDAAGAAAVRLANNLGIALSAAVKIAGYGASGDLLVAKVKAGLVPDVAIGRGIPGAPTVLPRPPAPSPIAVSSGGGGGAASAASSYQTLLASLDPVVRATNEFATAQTTINAALKAGEITATDAAHAYDLAKDRFEQATASAQAGKGIWDSFATAGGSAIDSLIAGTGKLIDVLKEMIKEIVLAIVKQNLLKSVSGGAAGDSVGTLLFKGLFGGLFHDAGGTISTGQSGIVGERGPEIVSATSSGAVVTSRAATSQMARGGQTVAITIDARGAQMGVAEQIDKKLRAVIPQIIGQSVGQVKAQWKSINSQYETDGAFA